MKPEEEMTTNWPDGIENGTTIAAPVDRLVMHDEPYLKRWDEWRRYIASGGKGSWPRDEFEGVLEELYSLKELAKEIADGNFNHKDVIAKARELSA